jgi:SAM-dependent methyltransferase
MRLISTLRHWIKSDVAVGWTVVAFPQILNPDILSHNHFGSRERWAMERVQEPLELMNDEEQARAYAEADFAEADRRFIVRFGELFPDYDGKGLVLDLGCGPANITLRFAQRYPDAVVHGVDGSSAMLKYGQLALSRANDGSDSRVKLIKGFIPGVELPTQYYDVIVSNSLLHHLPDPQALWTTIKEHSKPGTRVLVADLYRPATSENAYLIVETYSGGEPEVLKTDFFNSLLAAFTPREVESHLAAAGLSSFTVQTISDRHMTIYGVMR